MFALLIHSVIDHISRETLKPNDGNGNSGLVLELIFSK